MYILGDSQPCKCHATLAGFPSCEPTLCFKYCACRVRTACGIMPSMLKRIFFFPAFCCHLNYLGYWPAL